MSLIEQAAKRLEELRRAGAELPEKPGASGNATPTPEALVRVLDARGALESIVSPVGRPAPRDERRRAPGSEPERTHRHIVLDLDRIKKWGFITPDAPRSKIADEFRVIKRPIIRNALGQGGAARVPNGNLIMVTSSLPREGKTFTSINLAMSIAMEVDNTVLLVDGDVAHPSIPGLLGTPHSPGLLDLLAGGEVDFADALIKTNIDKLTLLPAGSPHLRMTELLASEQMASLLRELATRYSDRIIIFDSPPLLATTEARVLATHMGQILMVVAADQTSQHAVKQALGTIESCDVVLMTLNKAAQTDVGTYYGYYGDDAAP